MDPLRDACIRGDVEQARQAIAAGADINVALDHLSLRALHIAARQGHAAVVELLLSHPNAEPFAITKRGETALFYACRENRLDVVELMTADARRLHWHLLQQQQQPGPRDERLQQQWADSATDCVPVTSARGNTRILKLLLDTGADPNGPPSAASRPPIQLAAESGHAAAARLLLDAGARLPETNLQGWTLCLAFVREVLAQWQRDLQALREARAVGPALQQLVVDAAGALRDLSEARGAAAGGSGGDRSGGGGQQAQEGGESRGQRHAEEERVSGHEGASAERQQGHEWEEDGGGRQQRAEQRRGQEEVDCRQKQQAAPERRNGQGEAAGSTDCGMNPCQHSEQDEADARGEGLD